MKILFFYKNSLSHEFSFKGFLGGIRAADQAKVLLNKLGAVSIPYTLSIGEVDKKISQDGCVLNSNLKNSIKKIVRDLLWYTVAYKNQRDRFGEL